MPLVPLEAEAAHASIQTKTSVPAFRRKILQAQRTTTIKADDDEARVEIERRRQQALYDREQKLIEELRQKKEIEERREQRLREEEERRSEIERQRQELAEKRFQTLRAPQILLPSPANQYAPDISLSPRRSFLSC